MGNEKGRKKRAARRMREREMSLTFLFGPDIEKSLEEMGNTLRAKIDPDINISMGRFRL